MTISLEEAFRTAIEYETRVAAVYADAAARVHDPAGRRLFAALAREEEGHVAYLKGLLDRWLRAGALSPGALATAVPGRGRIEAAARALRRRAEGSADAAELQLLRRARAVEMATSEFYRRLVDELPGEPRALFSRFLEIEEGHLAIVQAEIDHVDQMGFWLDFPEFDLAVEPGR